MFLFRSISQEMTTALRSLGDAARHGLLLKITCRRCKRVARYLASDLLQFHGTRGLEAMRFKCLDCGAPGAGFILELPPRPKDPDVVVWRPVYLRRSPEE